MVKALELAGPRSQTSSKLLGRSRVSTQYSIVVAEMKQSGDETERRWKLYIVSIEVALVQIQWS